MTEAQQAAYVIAQAACVQAEIAAMQITNMVAMAQGERPPHSGDEFRALIDQYDISSNAVLCRFAW